MRAAWAQSTTILWKEADMKLLRLQRYILFICSLTGGVALEKNLQLVLNRSDSALGEAQGLVFFAKSTDGKNAQICVEYTYTQGGQLLMEGAAGLSLRKCSGKAH